MILPASSQRSRRRRRPAPLLTAAALAVALGPGCSDPAPLRYRDAAGAGAPGFERASSEAGAVELPFVLSDHFEPSGCMGDCLKLTAAGESAAETRAGRCVERAPGAQGQCFHVDYVAAGGQGWAGTMWQYPADNWGAIEGLTLVGPPRQVTFAARACSGTVPVNFQVGVRDPALPHADAFERETRVSLTTSWQRFSVDVDRDTREVVNGFGWIAQLRDEGAVCFEVDDIRWE